MKAKANIVPKTIRINKNGSIKESMSFPTFKFTEIINENWKDSELREMFNTTKFMFAVFKEYDGKYHFENIKFWNMPVNILDNDVKSVWDKTIDVIKKGEIVNSIKSGKRIINFPGMFEEGTMEVYKDGEKINYEIGRELSAYGNYKVVLTDSLGNSRTVNFSIEYQMNGWAIALVVVGVLALGTLVGLVIFNRRKAFKSKK